jgi:Polysaccharide biosynthesis/export protein
MRGSRLLLAVLAALTLSACARQQQTYVMDPNTGQPVPVMTQQQMAQPDSAQRAFLPPGSSSYAQSGGRGLFSSSPASAQQSYAQQSYAQQDPAPQAAPSGRGLFNSRMSAQPSYPQQTYAPQVYAPAPQVYAPQPYVPQQTYAPQSYPPQQAYAQQPPPRQSATQPIYVPPQGQPSYAPQPYAQPTYAQQGGPYVAAPYGYASAPANGQQTYTLDSGDKLRVVVFGQDGITNSYTVDAGGNISLPLIGSVPARGYGTQQLSQMIAERLKQGFVR